MRFAQNGFAGAGAPDNERFMQTMAGLNSAQAVQLASLQRLGAVRAAHSALRTGTLMAVSATADTLADRMSDDTETIFVLVNRADSATNITGLLAASFADLLWGATASGPSVTVAARSARPGRSRTEVPPALRDQPGRQENCLRSRPSSRSRILSFMLR